MKTLSHQRTGLTLIEVILLISVSSVLLTITAIWIHKILLFSTSLAERQRDHVNLNRLAAEIRQDVQFAREWSMPGPNELMLSMEDGSQVRYSLVKEHRRSVVNVLHSKQSEFKTENQISTPARRDQFKFTSQCQLEWQTTEFPHWLSLVATRVPYLLANPLPRNRPEISSSFEATEDFRLTVSRRRTCRNEDVRLRLTVKQRHRELISGQCPRADGPTAHSGTTAEQISAEQANTKPDGIFINEPRPVELILRLSPKRWPGKLSRKAENDL